MHSISTIWAPYRCKNTLYQRKSRRCHLVLISVAECSERRNSSPSVNPEIFEPLDMLCPIFCRAYMGYKTFSAYIERTRADSDETIPSCLLYCAIFLRFLPLYRISIVSKVYVSNAFFILDVELVHSLAQDCSIIFTMQSSQMWIILQVSVPTANYIHIFEVVTAR
jgi:hypothetical protein